ncbi:MAG: PQQ-like beta-propeller repeat protein [Alphaproteobacteria bacterium]|nr:PQQ-like beta-propeller repeat protein [Alphaproteobacteria bacterium]MBN2675304.1 PQQ-like beta-propeller repeat protein [Alphaproteobacteria bacterium]
MHKISILISLLLVFLTACSKQDPILPGQRESIFQGSAITVIGKEISDLPENTDETEPKDCPYTQDSSNIIWDGDKKIFSGFPTNNFVKNKQIPVCDGNFIYAGLTTGELVKVNKKTRDIAWITDIYRESNLTGGADVLDIVAPIIVKNDGVYVGGLGDAFCKLNKSDGHKIWCINISVVTSFIIIDNFAFVVGTNNKLYAINTAKGDIYWDQKVEQQSKPIYKDKTIIIDDEVFEVSNGKKIH